MAKDVKAENACQSESLQRMAEDKPARTITAASENDQSQVARTL